MIFGFATYRAIDGTAFPSLARSYNIYEKLKYKQVIQ
jgi:hypothetical protein